MGPFLVAWLVGMGLNIAHGTYNYKVESAETGSNGKPVKLTSTGPNPLPPKPGRLLIASGIYVGLAILAESESLRSTATMAAWGYNAAIALNFAQDVAAAKNLKLATNKKITWNPPLNPNSSLFPVGASTVSATPSAASTNTPPSNPGTVVA